MFEPSQPECAERPSDLPANNSGVRVLVYGLSKTGTKTMQRALYRIGLRHSYHSEDLSYWVVSRLADRYWLRPENGGRRAGTSHGIYLLFGRDISDLNLEYSNDTKVFESLRPEDLAASLAGCRVDSIAFDGLEHAFWPIYDVSPATKVLILDWRTVTEWNNSRSEFGPLLLLNSVQQGVVFSSFNAMPWGAVTPYIDWLFGSPGYRHALEGGPPMGIVGFGLLNTLYTSTLMGRRIFTHTYAGLKAIIITAEEYEDFYRVPYERVPPERRMSWNMRKHRFEDLCAFLDIPASDCPAEGLLPNAPTWWDEQRDRTEVMVAINLIAVGLHWVNWQVFQAGLTGLSSLFGWLWRRFRGAKSAASVE